MFCSPHPYGIRSSPSRFFRARPRMSPAQIQWLTKHVNDVTHWYKTMLTSFKHSWYRRPCTKGVLVFSFNCTEFLHIEIVFFIQVLSWNHKCSSNSTQICTFVGTVGFLYKLKVLTFFVITLKIELNWIPFIIILSSFCHGSFVWSSLKPCLDRCYTNKNIIIIFD